MRIGRTRRIYWRQGRGPPVARGSPFIHVLATELPRLSVAGGIGIPGRMMAGDNRYTEPFADSRESLFLHMHGLSFGTSI